MNYLKIKVIMSLTFFLSPLLNATFQPGERCIITKGKNKGEIVHIVESCKTKYRVNSIFEFLQKISKVIKKKGIESHAIAEYTFDYIVGTTQGSRLASEVSCSFQG